MALLPLAGCSLADAPTQGPGELRDAPLRLPGDALALVELAAVAPPEGYGRAKELAGGLTASFELALTDLEGVVPRVGAMPPSPGVSEAVLVDAERWTLTLVADVERVGPERWGMTIRGTLCRRDGACTFPEAEGDPNQTGPAVAELMEQIALRLVRRRGELMFKTGTEVPGAMAAILGERDIVASRRGAGLSRDPGRGAPVRDERGDSDVTSALARFEDARRF
jgi:hypothetical protein